MASVTLLLMPNKANKKGEQPLYLRIIKGRRAKYIALGIRVHADLWNAEKLRVKSQYPNSGRVNAFIARKIAEAEGIALDLESQKGYFSSSKIKEEIIGKEPASFIKYFDEFMEDVRSQGKIGSYNKINSVGSKLKIYLKHRDISFQEMDIHFIKQYESYLRVKLGNCNNTIHANLKIFRKLFNDAIREEIIEQSPFAKYKFKLDKTKTEFLTEEELLKFEEVPLEKDTKMFHHRNMYLFAAHAGGIRISDLLILKWENFDGSHIRFQTQKTKETLSIKLPAKALEILSIYGTEKKPSHFIFPIFSNDVDYSVPTNYFKSKSSATAYANKDLKTICSKAKIDKQISFHSSRHTWATRALRKGMRIEYVSKLMGHASIKTTQIYTKIVNSELDAAMSIFDD
jgi:integrase/recombinase XerD